MEENKLSHKKLMTSQDPASFSHEPNEKLKSNTQECKSPNTKDNDDKAKEHLEEELSKNIGEVGVEALVEETGRERLKRLREEVVKKKVNIPENWCQEQRLKDWIDYTMFDALFAPHSLIVTARDALIANGKAKSPRLRI